MRFIFLIVVCLLGITACDSDPCHGYMTCEEYMEHVDMQRDIEENQRRANATEANFEQHRAEITEQVNELNRTHR